MSDSVRPHRLQPTRLCHPWGSPGKNTGVGCHFLLQCMKMKSESEVAQLCPTLHDRMDCSLPGSSVHGIFQARVLKRVAIAFSEVPPYNSFKKKNAPLHTHAHTKPINARLYYTHWIQKPMISESGSVSHSVIIVCFSLLFYFYLVQISSLVPETIKEEQKTYDSFYYACNYQFCFLVVRLITLIFR